MHPAWRAGFDACHGSDICNGTNWAIVQADAEAPGVCSAILLTLTILILLGNIVLVAKKHVAGLTISFKVPALMPLFYFPMPIVVAKTVAPAQGLLTTANEVAGLPPPIVLLHSYTPLRLHLLRFTRVTQFYEMAAKDKVCGNNLAALKDLDLGVWIGKPGDVDCHLCIDRDSNCTADLKWIEAPAPTLRHFGQQHWYQILANWMLHMNPRNPWGFNPCWRTGPEADPQDYSWGPYVWFVLWWLWHSHLWYNIYDFKEELVKSQRRVHPLTAVTAAAANAAAANAAAPPPHRTVVHQAPQPQIFWPPALRVGSVSRSAPVPPAFICPITMTPMANPAITPRGTSYDRKALCEWITKEHRYPGGEVRATAHKLHTPYMHTKWAIDARAPPHCPPHSSPPLHHHHPPTLYAQGPGKLELDRIAPNYALRMLIEAWIELSELSG